MLKAIREQIKKKNLTLQDIMTEHVVTLPEDTPLQGVAHLLLRDRLSGIPIVNETREMIGIITVTDLFKVLNTVMNDAEDRPFYDSTQAVLARDLMTRTIVSIPHDMDLESVVELMCTRNIHTVPVLCDGQLTGIVGRHDILNAVF